MKTKVTSDIDNDQNDDAALIKHVDAMMDIHYQEDDQDVSKGQVNEVESDGPVETVVIEPPAVNAAEPIDIFADIASAPMIATEKKKESEDSREHQPTKIKIVKAKNESDAEIPVEVEPDNSADVSSDKSNEETNKPLEYDDQELDQAITEIVNKESDEVLLVEDTILKDKQAQAKPIDEKRFKHPIFWSMVAIVSCVAIAMIVFLIDPNIHNPISKVDWSKLEHRF